MCGVAIRCWISWRGPCISSTSPVRSSGSLDFSTEVMLRCPGRYQPIGSRPRSVSRWTSLSRLRCKGESRVTTTSTSASSGARVSPPAFVSVPRASCVALMSSGEPRRCRRSPACRVDVGRRTSSSDSPRSNRVRRIWPLIFCMTSDNICPTIGLSSSTVTTESKMRGLVPASKDGRSGSSCGASNQR